jgi:hypothetical protein
MLILPIWMVVGAFGVVSQMKTSSTQSTAQSGQNDKIQIFCQEKWKRPGEESWS